MTKRILNVVTNVSHYADASHPTGLWLAELTHAWQVFDEHGFEQTLVSPAGGPVPLEPRSLKFPAYDRSARAWHTDPDRMALLKQTAAPGRIDPSAYDAIFLTGGHAVMYDFTDSAPLQDLTRTIFEQGGIVASVCHGYCGLLNTTLSDGSHLIAGRRLTGFAWREEHLAGVASLVPYNAEQVARDRGGLYQKAKVPFVSHVVADGRLITGQNPASAKATATAVAAALR
jgi:putative intracellular protease/amidase